MKYYTYLWRDPKGIVFYVGKGSGNRAWDTYPLRRSSEFVEIASQDGSRAELVRRFEFERDAYAHEMVLVSTYGRRDQGGTLINKTDGGDGARGAGAMKTDETRRKMSIAAYARDPIAYRRMSIAKHMAPPPATNKSGYKGVMIEKTGRSWRATIRLGGRNKSLGRFPSAEQAARAYDLAAISAWGLGNCYLNFPEDYDLALAG